MSTWASAWVPLSPKQYDIPLKKRARGYNCTALAALAGWMRGAEAQGIRMDGQLKITDSHQRRESSRSMKSVSVMRELCEYWNSLSRRSPALGSS